MSNLASRYASQHEMIYLLSFKILVGKTGATRVKDGTTPTFTQAQGKRYKYDFMRLLLSPQLSRLERVNSKYLLKVFIFIYFSYILFIYSKVYGNFML